MSITDIFKLTSEVERVISQDAELKLLDKLLLLECKHNLNLINCLKKEVSQDSTEILSIVQLMETDVLGLYLSEQIKSQSLISKVVDKFKDEIDNEKESLIENTLLKIKILKSIASLPTEDKHGYRKFRLKTRLVNLKSKLCLLIDSLGGF